MTRGLVIVGLAGAVLLAYALIGLHLGPEIVLGAVVVGALLVGLMISPLMGVHVLVMLIYFEQVAVLPEGWTVYKTVGPIIVGAWLMNMAFTRRVAVRIDPFMMTIVAFVAWSGLSLFYASNTNAALIRLGTLAQLGVATLMISSVLDSPRRIRQILWAIVLWTTVATIIGLVLYNLGLNKDMTGPAENRNGFAMFLDIAIISAFLLQQQTSSRVTRLAIMFGLIPLFLFCLALTLSRGGWISLLVGVVLVWFRAASERRFWPVVTMIAVVCVIVPLLPDVFWKRAGTILPSIQERKDTFGERVDLWRLGMKMVQEHPVFGVGIGNFVNMSTSYARGGLRQQNNGAHNSYVSVAAETGLVGLALFLWIQALALRSARLAIRKGKELGLSEVRMCGMVVEIGILAMLVMGLSGSLEGIKLVWVFLAMANSLGVISRRLQAPDTVPLPSALASPSMVPS